MLVGNPSATEAALAHDTEQFSFLSDNSSMDDASLLCYSDYVDENALCPPSTRISFTPTRLKPQPRAWERKPSTPFAPRSDTQKIWKRVPLQPVTSSINASWRKSNNHGDGIMRPVKRQRILGHEDIENKGNAEYIGVKWDQNLLPDTSPRRRGPSNHQAGGQTFKALSPQENKILSDAIDTVMPSDLVKSSNAEVNMVEDTGVDMKEGTSGKSPTEVSGKIEGHAATEQLLGEADVFLRISPESSPIQSSPMDIAFNVSSFDSDPFDPNTRMSPVLPVSRSPLKDGGQKPVPKSEPRRHLPAEEEQVTAPAHNDQDDTSYLQDFLLRSRAQKAAKSQQPVANNDEDKQPGSQNDIKTDAAGSRTIVESTMATEYTSSVSEPRPDEISTESPSSPKPLSPQRRSNRLTRLPRPQKLSTTLPNSIALRRLNGSEFISLHREAQSLAATTRGNTRKNKGTAVGVQARLIELKTEYSGFVGGEEEGPHGGIKENADAAAAVGFVVQGEQTAKRKSVIWAEVLALFQEYDAPESIKSSPESHSNSQNTYHPEPTSAQTPEMTDAATPSPELQTTTTEQNHGTAKMESKQSIDKSTTEAPQKRTAKRVRKLRKESVGSVNGTPAPKRSIEILLRDAAAAGGKKEDGLEMVESGDCEKGLSKGRIDQKGKEQNGNESFLGKRTRSRAKH